MKGTIFDIQRFCLHDGPGIRTTAFIKGCALRCRWCHNPEGLEPRVQLGLKESKCVHCGRCLSVCPLHTLDQAGHHQIRFQGCKACGKCVESCPSKALFLSGRHISAEELANQLLRDRVFYGQEGGATFSGGEPLLQAEFVAECASLLKSQGISVAVDTSGCVPFTAFDAVLPVTDLFLFDIKAAHRQIHHAATGRDNDLILDNLRRLDERKARIWIRIPLIHEVNDSDEEIRAIADIIASVKHTERVTPIPYHDLGSSKYAELGMESHMTPSYRISQERVDEIYRLLADRLGGVRIG